MDPVEFRELRRGSGLTQLEVAKEIGVDKQTICRWERGRHRIGNGAGALLLFLVTDDRRVEAIKSLRPARVRGRPFQKKQR